MDKDNQASDELPMLRGSKHVNKRVFAAFMIFGLLNNGESPVEQSSDRLSFSAPGKLSDW